MGSRQHLIRPLLFAAVTLAAAPQASAGFKCWTNSEGLRECGNAVPPEYAQQGHSAYSAQGVKVDEVERAMTRDELQAQREADRLAAEQQAKEEKRHRVRAAEDRVLLHTFSTEDDLRLAHQGKIAAIESRVKLSKSRVGKLEQNLKELEQLAARRERSGKPLSKALRSDIARVKRELTRNESYIRARAVEQQELADKYEMDLERFRLLKSGHPIGAPDPQQTAER